MTAYLYEDGRHYDQLFTGTHDLTFWINQAKKYKDPILELACGTGRVTLFLAEHGYCVTGIDSSEAMLVEARQKAVRERAEVEWVPADMRDFALGKTFSLVILPANTLCHLLTLQDFEACIQRVKQHLAPMGRFIIDVFVPKMELLINKPGERFPFGEYHNPDGGGKVIVTHSYRYDSDRQIKRIQIYHAFSDTDQEIKSELDMRMYFPQELDALLQYNGMTIEEKFGDYTQAAFDDRAEKQLVVCSITKS